MVSERKYALDALILEQIYGGNWLPELSTGKIYSRNSHKYLTGNITHGYRYVYTPGGVNIPVARVIWVAAYGVPEFNDLQIDHINEDKLDNRIDNLRMITASGNQLHSNSALTFEDAEEIRKKYAKSNVSIGALSREYGVSRITIRRIIQNEHYTNARKALDPLKLSEDVIKNVFNEVSYKGFGTDYIGKKYNLPRNAVQAIICAESQKVRSSRRKYHDN